MALRHVLCTVWLRPGRRVRGSCQRFMQAGKQAEAQHRVPRLSTTASLTRELFVLHPWPAVKGSLSAQKCGCASLVQQLQSTPAGAR